MRVPHINFPFGRVGKPNKKHEKRKEYEKENGKFLRYFSRFGWKAERKTWKIPLFVWIVVELVSVCKSSRLQFNFSILIFYLNDQASPLGKFIFLKFCSHNSHVNFASFQVEEKRSEKFSSLLNILYTYTPQIICWGMSGKKKFAKRFHVAVGEFFSDKINIK